MTLLRQNHFALWKHGLAFMDTMLVEALINDFYAEGMPPLEKESTGKGCWQLLQFSHKHTRCIGKKCCSVLHTLDCVTCLFLDFANFCHHKWLHNLWFACIEMEEQHQSPCDFFPRRFPPGSKQDDVCWPCSAGIELFEKLRINHKFSLFRHTQIKVGKCMHTQDNF